MFPPKASNFLKLFIASLFFIDVAIYAQAISVDTNYSGTSLTDLVIGDSCVPTSNQLISSNQSVAYFTNNNGTFPISEGVIIRSGVANLTAGTYTNENLSSQVNTNTDTDLQAISDNEGQASNITDVAFLQFDFIPLANSINFNFIFASNEYGEWQCGFSDVFAIILTNETTGEAINMATVPNTNTTISVRNIRDNQYNSSCTAINKSFFGNFYETTTANTPLNMRGHTVKLNAVANVMPNTEYNIKFVVGDYNDANYDSAVFIEANSFTSSIDLGENIVSCDGVDTILNTGLNGIDNLDFEWQFNGTAIANETSASITVNKPGTYTVLVTDNTRNCILTDQITITELEYNQPLNLFICETTSEVNLTQNNYAQLGVDNTVYTIEYYASEEDITANNPINNPTNFIATSGDTFYIKLRDNTTQQLCATTLSFQIERIEVIATTPENITVCENDSTVNIPEEVASQILENIENPSAFEILYYTDTTNLITNPTHFSIPNTTDLIPITAQLKSLASSDCLDTVTFSIEVNPIPVVDELESVYVCAQYILPALTNGNYYTQSGGNGAMLTPGTVIEEDSTIYVYAEDENNCSNESSFNVTIIEDFTLGTNYCNQFTVPTYPNANFYTASGGPDGSGNLLPAGTVLNTSQTIYFYATDAAGNFCVEKDFDINIIKSPPVDSLENVITCNAYTLPALTNGNYYSAANGTGNQLSEGTVITTSSIIYIYNLENLNNCSSQTSFKVDIIDTHSFQNLEACGSYTLPNISFGNYYTAPNGEGNVIPQGTQITTSQTVHYYASEITTTPNCSQNISFNITINPLPEVDTLEDIVRCENNIPTLPTLTNGNYFTQSGGNGTMLNAGDEINTSKTLYIYNTNQFCFAETSFNVIIREIPKVDNFTDIFSCEPYILPPLTNGNYFTQPSGNGTMLNAGEAITKTQSIYIYNAYNDLESCFNENVFKVNILGVTVDTPANVVVCEEYILPELSVGNYFTQSNGNGTMLNAGDTLTQTQTLYIYAENNNRFFCSDEHIFTVQVLNKPTLDIIDNMEGCGSVTLPNLTNSEITYQYYEGPNQTNLRSLENYTITDVGTKAIYIRAFPTQLPNCYTEKVITVTVYPLLELNISDGVICVDGITGETTNSILLESGVNPNEFEVNWYLEEELVGTGVNFEAFVAGVYRVETVKQTPEVGADCNYKPAEVEVKSSSPIFEITHLSNDFDALYSVKVETVVQGFGNYTYAIDGFNFQESPYFYNLTPGEYTITIKDTTGICDIFILDFLVLEYPKFFTPNGDGIKDTWNITDLAYDNDAIIKIFDRYGKIMAIIKPNGIGWDGRNTTGHKMPSTDYWFVAEYTSNGSKKQFKAHFSLLRKTPN